MRVRPVRRPSSEGAGLCIWYCRCASGRFGFLGRASAGSVKNAAAIARVTTGARVFFISLSPVSSSASLDRAARAEAGRAELEGHLQALVTLRGYVNERGRPFSAASIAAMLAAGLLKPTRMLA